MGPLPIPDYSAISFQADLNSNMVTQLWTGRSQRLQQMVAPPERPCSDSPVTPSSEQNGLCLDVRAVLTLPPAACLPSSMYLQWPPLVSLTSTF